MNTLKEEFIKAYLITSDINEHIPYLYNIALTCDSITEFGVSYGVSSRAFLYANKKLRSYDINVYPAVSNLFNNPELIDSQYIQGDTLKINIEPCDLLFIDTKHQYYQLKEELILHAKQVNKYIIFHDTQTFGVTGDDGGIGLLPAILEFLKYNRNWFIKDIFTNNNGLLVLEKINE